MLPLSKYSEILTAEQIVNLVRFSQVVYGCKLLSGVCIHTK